MLLTNVARSSPGVISAKKSDTCRRFAVQSLKLTKGKAGKERKETTHEGPQLEFETWHRLA